MAKYEFDKNKFEEWKRAQKESAELQEKMNSSLGGYFETIKKIGELQKNLQFIEAKRNELAQEYGKSAKEVRDNWAKLIEARKRGDADEIKALKEKDKELRKILAAKKEGLKITEAELNLLKEQTEQLKESAKQASLMSAGLGSAVGFLGKTPGLIAKGFGMLKGTGIFEMDKEIRNAVRSMAGGQKEYKNMLGTIKEASDTTTFWGVGVKDLAIMQRGYSEAIGKSVMLTEEGYKSMARLAEGTGLGKEFAVQIAGEMDKFNISAERTSSIVENTMNTAAKIGVNGAAALKSLQNNLKLAQRFNFKGGIAGLAKLSAEATKLRLDMEGIAGFADKVFRPEGAIELAARLTTLGGRFAALGDPMQLMFQARNDFEGFSKNIAKASAEFVKFNKVTGEMEIIPGALDKMREISDATGIAVEKLQEMGEAQAKIEELGRGVKPGIFNEEDMSLISSFAKFKDGKWQIEAGQFSKSLKDLSKSDIERLKAEQKTLDDRAKDSRTFDETVQDLILMFKQQLLPFAETLKNEFGDKIIKLGEWFKSSEFKTLLNGLITKLQGFIKFLGDWVSENPVKTGIIAGIATLGPMIGKFLGPIIDAAKWFFNGTMLGRGFMATAGGMGGMAPGGMAPGGMAPGGGSTSFMGKLMGKNVAGGKFAAGTMGSVGLGLGLGALGMGMQYGRSQMDNPESTGGKLLGVGGTAAQYAAMGAMLGPWGALAGGLIGAGMGAYDEFFAKPKAAANVKSAGSNQAMDYSSVRVNDAVMFHKNDKFLKVNDAMTIAGTSTSGNGKLAQELSSAGSSDSINHTFDALKIDLNVTAPSNMEFWKQLFNSPELMRRLTEEVNISSESAASGKISGKTKKKKP